MKNTNKKIIAYTFVLIMFLAAFAGLASIIPTDAPHTTVQAPAAVSSETLSVTGDGIDAIATSPSMWCSGTTSLRFTLSVNQTGSEAGCAYVYILDASHMATDGADPAAVAGYTYGIPSDESSIPWYICIVTDNGDYYKSSTYTIKETVTTLSVSVSSSQNPTDIGNSVTFTASPSNGSGGNTFQWYLNGNAVSGATASTYTTSFNSSGSDNVSVDVTDSDGGVASASITETVNPALTISVSSSQNPTTPSTSVTFSTSVTGGSGTYTSYSYILYDGTSTSDSELTSGTASEFDYTFPSTGNFLLTYSVTDSTGSTATSSLTENVSSGLSVVITSSQNPTDVGAFITFNASTSGGSGGNTYQWYLNGNAVSGANSSTYTTSFSSAGTEEVYIIVKDSVGSSVQSSTLDETVNADPTVSISSSQNPTDVGNSVTFTATGSSGTGSYTYQWYVNNNAVSGATSSTYSTSFSSSGSDTVYVVLTDGVDASATSSTITETVNPAPSVTISSSQNPTDVGNSVTFTASITGGTGSDTYTWYVDGSTQSSTINTLTETFSAVGTYYINVTVKDSLGDSASYSFKETVSTVLTVTLTSSQNPTDVGNSVSFWALASQNITPSSYTWYVNGASVGSGNPYYPITLSGVPSGTGTYQQLITINNPADYGINSNGSNILFFDNGNHTELYAWEQSVNSSAIQVWIKNYNSSSVIDMEVLAGSDNELSANGYLQNLNMHFSGVSGQNSTDFYANSSSGDYINFALPANINKITYEVNTTGLGDFFLFTNSTGAGQMVRLDGRAGEPDSAFGTTNSWTSWAPPPGIYQATKDTWFLVSLTNVSNTWVYDITNESSGITTHVENYTMSYKGSYFGFIGDGLGSRYITYWKDITFYTSQYGATGFYDTLSMPTYSIGNAGTVYTTTFSSAGSDSVYAKVTDAAGNTSDSSTITETVNADPTVSITSSQNSTDANVGVTFTNTITGGTGPDTYAWYENNVQVSTNSSFFFNTSSPGSYNISLIIKDKVNRIADSQVIDEIVVADPVITVTYSTTPIVSESVSIYTHISGGVGNFSLQWTFTGGTSTGRNVSYAFETAGNRTFSIKLTDGSGYTNTQHFTVYVQLKIEISETAKSGKAPLTVQFEGEALGGSSYIWYWNFDDGNTSASQDASNIFGAGNYTVTLTVTDSAGITGTASVYIQAWPAPVKFVYSNNQNITYDFHFTAVPNWDAKGPYNASWNMPNGQTLYGLNISYYFPVYSKTNDISVDFTFSNTSIYQGDSYSKTIVVTMKPANISVKFSYPDPIPVNTILDLNVSVTAPDTNSFTISWNVSGQYATGNSFTYDFTNIGTFYINISISDNLGAYTHISRMITVQRVSSSSHISIGYTTTTNASVIGYNISVHAQYPIQSVQAYLDGSLLAMNMTYSGGNATAGYIQYYTFSLNQRDYSTGDYQINIDVFTTNSQSNATSVPFLVSSKYSNSAPFNIVAFFGGVYNMIYILLTIGGIIVTVVLTRPKATDIDIDGTVLQAKPGKPVKELKRRK